MTKDREKKIQAFQKQLLDETNHEARVILKLQIREIELEDELAQFKEAKPSSADEKDAIINELKQALKTKSEECEELKGQIETLKKPVKKRGKEANAGEAQA